MSAIERVSATFQIGAKGRVVIPVAVRRAAHIEESDTVVAHVNALGQVVIESESALKARLWSAVPATNGAPDSTVEVRSMRDEDSRLSDRNYARRRAVDEGGSQERSAALLAHLRLKKSRV